jgi:glycosyltransferase involved in cell wall biosynthesis
LVTLREGFEGLVVPSKLLGHLARGVPTLYVGPDSDISHYIRESDGGLCVNSGAVEALAGQLAELAEAPQRLAAMGTAAQRYYESKLAKGIGLSLYRRALLELADAGTMPGAGT